MLSFVMLAVGVVPQPIASDLLRTRAELEKRYGPATTPPEAGAGGRASWVLPDLEVEVQFNEHARSSYVRYRPKTPVVALDALGSLEGFRRLDERRYRDKWISEDGRYVVIVAKDLRQVFAASVMTLEYNHGPGYRGPRVRLPEGLVSTSTGGAARSRTARALPAPAAPPAQ